MYHSGVSLCRVVEHIVNSCAELSFLVSSPSGKGKWFWSIPSETSTLKRSACVQTSLLLPVAFTRRLKPSTHHLPLLAALPRSFLFWNVELHRISMHCYFGQHRWAPWALLAFFKIFIIINLGEPNLLRCPCFWPCIFQASASLGQRSSFNTDPSLAQGWVSPVFCFLLQQELGLPEQHPSFSGNLVKHGSSHKMVGALQQQSEGADEMMRWHLFPSPVLIKI